MPAQKKRDLFHRVLNIVLAVLYIPWVLVCSLAGLVQDGLVNETNVFLLASGQIVTWSGLLVAFTSHYCLYLSNKMYAKGKTCASYVVRFLPVIIMVIAFLIYGIAYEIVRG